MPTPSLMAASTYDVFLSFSGDTRYGFAANLYIALAHRGIQTFIDDMVLQKGQHPIITTLLKAIHDSRIAIVVLSRNYASSYYCLEELATMLHCQTKGLLVIPVFYKVRPSDVRNQKGSYGKALSKLQKRFKDKEKLQKWKMALCQVANLSGYHFEDGVGYEHKFIEKIVEHVHKITRASFVRVADHPVGLYSQVLEVRKLLDCGSEDGVHMIGIHGMGGVGKSTLARAVYNDLIAENFDGFCFLENVREKANKYGLEHLQSILLSQILGEKDINLTSKKQGISMIKYRLNGKKVLLILDDVDKLDQLQAIAGGRDWFGPGSIIMVTTRDKQLLKTHQVTITYEVKGLNDNDALQLLKWKAFRKEKADPDYEVALNRVETYASGLPLALEVIGSNLYGKSIQGWETAIKQYERIPKREILNILKVSFDDLEEEEKSIFLDIACFFKGCALTEVQDILHAYYGPSMKHHIGVLVEKSLLKFDYFDDRFTMHDLLQDMGKMIVWMELQKEPGKSSRLWLPNMTHVSDYNTRTSESEINYHDFLKSDKKGTVGWDANTFKWMNSREKFLKTLQFVLRNHNYFPQIWRALRWNRYPLNCLASELDNLLKKFENLTAIKFEKCKILTQTPDLSDLPHLEELSFKGCENLIAVHDSVGFLTKLKILRFVRCSKLISFPLLDFSSLERLELKNCSSLENIQRLTTEWESAKNEYDSVGLESCSDAFSYDVFLSFRGSDTRYGFTGYLYKALHDSGIHTFIDDENLKREEQIKSTIVKAIEESRIAITVLSINYASSTCCLDELATILDCLKRKKLQVLPVFYYVDPTQVQLQKGSFGEAFTKHEERLKHNMKRLMKWKMALHQVANLFGFHIELGAGYEYEFIEEIVEWVSRKINPAHYPVGLGSQVLEIMELLDVGCDGGVHMIGIHGVGGVGKSTLAQEVYNNLIADKFDGSCFIENVREKSNKHGLQYLQSILLSKILGEKDIKLTSVQQGTSMIQRRLQQKKVLLILDDVDRQEQLQAVVGRADWFGPGSRIIITTRDEQLLASYDVQRTYEVKKLNKNDALGLLKWKAFKMHYYDQRYEELLNRAVTFASGIPLALEVIGSNLYGKSVEEWKNVIHQFEKSPNSPVQAILKASFDSLEEKERSVFLDIACCFKGYELAEVEDILQAHYGQNMKCYIDVLVDKSLVKLSHGTKPCYNRVTLHDLIEDMAKDIVRQESLIEPGECRRLWLLKDVREVLKNNRGTSKIEIICLDFPIFDQEEIVEWDGKAFQNMQNLKTLIIRNGNFSKGPEYLPDNLRVLEWWRYPSNCLPSDFHPKELAICKLPCSSISTIELTNLLKKLVNLRVFNFSNANV